MDESTYGVANGQLQRRTFLKSMGVLAGAGVALAGLPGCSSAGAKKASTTKKSKKSLVVYSTTLPQVQADLAKAFTGETGIHVTSLRLATGLLSQRFSKEQDAGHYATDILTLGDQLFIADMAQKGYLADISDYPGVSSLPDEWKSLPNYVTLTKAPDTIGYNTDLVPKTSIPKDWSDLLNPEFRGQIILPDPRNNEVLLGQFFLAVAKKYGDDFFRKLARQDLILTPSAPPGLTKVAAGDAKLVLATPAMNLTDYVGKDAPIDVVSPAPSPTDAIFFYMTVPSHAPNPEGAKKWVEFVLSEKGQEIVNNFKGLPIGTSPLGAKVKGSMPPSDEILSPSPSRAKAQVGKYMKLLNIGA